VSDGNDKTQYEQENDFGRGGGEVSEETLKEAYETSEERTGPNPWAKTSSGDKDDVVQDSDED
jgi:hypothetical protein